MTFRKNYSISSIYSSVLIRNSGRKKTKTKGRHTRIMKRYLHG